MLETCLSNPAINCSFYLFQSGGMVVEVNLVGAVVPLSVSGVILAYYRRTIHWLRLVQFTFLSFLVITTLGGLVGVVYGGISLQGWVYIVFWIFVVLWYSRLKFVRREALLTVGELYVIGTIGVFLDDAVRTFLGLYNVPIVGLGITPNIWGAAGPMDGIFMTGLYQAVIYLAIAVVFMPKKSTDLPTAHSNGVGSGLAWPSTSED